MTEHVIRLAGSRHTTVPTHFASPRAAENLETRRAALIGPESELTPALFSVVVERLALILRNSGEADEPVVVLAEPGFAPSTAAIAALGTTVTRSR